jgi:hypothetical protein
MFRENQRYGLIARAATAIITSPRETERISNQFINFHVNSLEYEGVIYLQDVITCAVPW